MGFPKCDYLPPESHSIYGRHTHLARLVRLKANQKRLMEISGLNVALLYVTRLLSINYRLMPLIIKNQVLCAVSDMRNYSQNRVLTNQVASAKPVWEMFCSNEEIERRLAVLVGRLQCREVLLQFAEQICWCPELEKLKSRAHTASGSNY